MDVSQADLRALLRQFGHEAFRPGQEHSMRSLLAGRDVLAVLPTGSGKSLVYQMAAQLLPGITIVVSPLLALMKDQVDSVEDIGFEAGAITSAQSADQAEEIMRQVRRGEAKLLYVTPERFENDDFMAEMKGREISLFVVDEAHCISEWGHDFRPSYLGLADVLAALGRPTVLALTATAPPFVRDEIIQRLGMRKPEIIVHGVDRPNLFLEVRRIEREEEEHGALRDLLFGKPVGYPPEVADKLAATMQGAGIIYTATTKAAEETATWLREWGVEADFYHGQRAKEDRERVQEAFMGGALRVIVATNAFGLGVDKADVRFVIHRDVPGSLEAYYQEAGRAGRDGQLARCTLIYRPTDMGRAAFLAASGRLTQEDLERGRAGLLARPNASRKDLEEITGLAKTNLTKLITLLHKEGIVKPWRGRLRLEVPDFDPAQVSLADEERRKAFERSRLEMMRGYAELTADCRRRYILNYFMEEYDRDRCALCDNDVVHASGNGWVRVNEAEEQATPVPLSVGDRVTHEEWGEGLVERVTTDMVTVLFNDVGYKTLSLAIVWPEKLRRVGQE